jgi:hypothetical protein
MPRKEALALENKFTRGLITEFTPLAFPTDACTETYDCVFNERGYVTRRLGFDLESSYVETSTTAVTDEAHSQYVWDSIKSYSNGSFLVSQQGKYLHFFDITSNTIPSANHNATVIDLTTYQILGSSTAPSTYRCQYAQGNGYLLVTNPYCHPIYIEYSLSGNSFTVTPFILRERDFVGIDDGLDLVERPVSSLSALLTNNPAHYYNMYNQGWYSDALTDWDTAVGTLPSNADAVGYFRLAVDNYVSAASIKYNSPGSSPAPKGHFILEVGAPDRSFAFARDTAAYSTSGYLFDLPTYPDSVVSTGTTIGDFITRATNAFDGNISQNAANSAATAAGQTTGYIGKSFASAKRISRMTMIATTDTGFHNGAGIVNVTVYAKNGAPSSSTDGAVIATDSLAVDAIGASFIIPCDDNALAFTHWWVTFDSAGAAVTFQLCELDMWEAVKQTSSPSCVAFFAGRSWFSGYNDPSLGSKVFFSQIVDTPDKFKNCHQTNDPASDKYPDLLATDGGVINIPEMNRVIAMFNFQSQLLILANNGIWIVSGNSAGIFSATDYGVKKISSIGCTSPGSVVDVKGLPIWWGEDGIYTVKYDANYNSTVVEPITEGTIKQFFLGIVAHNRQYASSAYDKFNDVVYWTYNNATSGNFTSAKYYVFNSILCLNMKTGAFYPWTISTSGTVLQSVRGVAYIQDGNRQKTPKMVFPITYTRGGTYRLTMAEAYNTSYKDWTSYKTLTTNTNDEVDYSSYFIAGYRLDGQAMLHFQNNYLYTYMAQVANSSLFMQGLYEFTSSASSHKWTTAQQVYNSKTDLGRTYHDTKVSRRMVRGSGKTLRLKYYSETAKPFTCTGWGLYISGNDRV